MNKKAIVALLIGIIAAFTVLALCLYFMVLKAPSYTYKTKKGQQYSLTYFKNAKVIDTKDLAEKLGSTEFEPGTPLLVSYIREDLGIAMLISDAIDKPISKSCTNTERLAFTVDDYEVCKIDLEKKTIGLLAKVGNKSQYFVATLFVVYDGKRITDQKDKTYIKQFNNFDILDYQKEIKEYLRSIQPLN